MQEELQKIILNTIRAYLDVYSNQSVVSLRKKSLDRFKENVDATELKLQGLIIDPEKTRKNEGGKQEIIYKLRDLSVIDMHDLSKDKTDKE